MSDWYGTKEFDAFREDVKFRIEKKYGITEFIKGFPCPISQTGEEYIEIILTAQNTHELAKMMAGAIAAYGKSGDRLYWRIEPEYDETMWKTKKAYARFLVTGEKEIFTSMEEAKAWWLSKSGIPCP